MALPHEAEDLWREITSAVQWLKPYLDQVDGVLTGYVGLDQGRTDSGEHYENHAHEYLSLTIPKLVANNPRVKCSTKRGGKAPMVSAMMQAALNRWIQDTNHRRFLERAAADYLTGWTIAMVTLEARPGQMDNEDVVTRPIAVLLDRRDVFWDPLAPSWERCRYIGHKFPRDLEDLIAEAKENPELGWDLAEVEALAADAALDELGRARDGGVLADGPRRGEVLLYEVWIPEIDLEGKRDERHFGALYTLAHCASTASKDESKSGPRFVRKPRPFYGPRTGPYYMFGCYDVPNRSVPLSPLVANRKQAAGLNATSKVLNDAIAAYKKIGVGEALKPAEAKRIKSASHGDVVLVAGIDKQKFLELELGGPTETIVNAWTLQRQRLDTNAGMDDAVRGNVTGEGTATEVAIASETTSARMAFIGQKFQNSDEGLLRAIAWYMFNEETVVYPLGQVEGGRTLWFQGGTSSADDTGFKDFDDLEIQIERYSMERTSEALQARRAMEMVNIITTLAPQVPLIAQFTDVKTLVGVLGDALNLPDLGRVFDIDKAKEEGQRQMEAQSAGEEQPRLLRDVEATPRPKRPSATGSAKPGNKTGAAAGAAARSSVKQKSSY